VRKHVRRPSPALAVSLIALFVALGGTGYAAVTINGKDLKNKSVAGKKLKSKTITASKIKDKTITGAKLKDDTVTGTQVAESTLGKVPSATSADTATTATTATTASNASALGGDSANAFARREAGLTASFMVDGTAIENGFGQLPTVVEAPGIDTYTFPFEVNDGSHNVVVSGGGAGQTGGFTPPCYHVVDPTGPDTIEVYSFEADGVTVCDEEYTVLVF